MRCLTLVVSLSVAFCAPLLQAQETVKQKGVPQDGFQSIFNGKDLSGWKGNMDLWSVEEGAITGRTTNEKPIQFNTFLIWKENDVGNFELQLDYKITGGNSGIQYRSKILNEEDFVVGGYQADIDATKKFSGINYEEKARGILAQRGQRVTIDASGKKTIEDFADAAQLGEMIHDDDWNRYRVVADGSKLSHYINDHLMSEVIDHDNEKSAKEGVLAFQVHKGDAMVIQFKNVRLKMLK